MQSEARRYVLDNMLDLVGTRMQLRGPQKKSLDVIHRIVGALPDSIARVPVADICRAMRELNPGWRFDDGFPCITFPLATGVGKTRLMGAIIAYLYRCGMSSDFVILAPRDAILRKLQTEVYEGHPKYMFVDRAVVPQPRVWTKTNIDEFDPGITQPALLGKGPNVFIVSPQLLLTEGKIAKKNEFTGTSVLEYLRAKQDLVVLIDESHHLNPQERDALARSWFKSVKDLDPKIAFAVTATPPDGANVGYEYGLAQCLREGLYTKNVRLLVDKQSPDIEAEEYDTFTLDYALSRLAAKERTLKSFRQEKPAFPDLKPVLLVCAADTKHADQVGEWLEKERGLKADEILVIHSARKTEPDMQRLADIERSDSRIRVVVQVHVLDEGWDVTNVYVIAPLRNVQSYVNGRQVMGRGLRLPMGHRVGNTELDTLDVLAFGQQTVQDIYDQAKEEFGEGTGMTVVGSKGGGAPAAAGAVPAEQPPADGEVELTVPVERPTKIVIPGLEAVPEEPRIGATVARRLNPRTPVGVELGELAVVSTSEAAMIPLELFLDLAVNRTLEDCRYLSEPLHAEELKNGVRELLATNGWLVDGKVSVDPILVGKAFAEQISKDVVVRPPKYVESGGSTPVDARPYCIPVQKGLTVETLPECTGLDWTPDRHRRIPIRGWTRCVHRAASFDTTPEFLLACKLDGFAETKVWLRNSPALVSLPTLIHPKTGPDFIVVLRDGRIVFVEVKGEHLWQGPESEARLAHRDLRLWVKAANESAGKKLFGIHLLLGGDVERVNSWTDVAGLDAGS